MKSKNNFTIYLACLFMFVFQMNAQAQDNTKTYIISGNVIDDELKVPLEYATISIIDKNNPKELNGGVTDRNGKFSIEVPGGTYQILVEFISFETKEFKDQVINADLDFGTIELGMSANSLNEVVVRAETTEVEVRLDKKIYNIGKDLTTQGATVSDALNNVPSVSVDIDGAISLRGNENVRILINGKPSAMAGYGSTDVLNQLPAEAIDRVEVITSPSARYDAEGTAGILNIILRKDKTRGFNGSLNLNAGIPENTSLSLNANYKIEKFNFFTTTGYRYSENPGYGFFDTRYFANSTVEFDRIVENRDMDRINRSFNSNIGLEYYINDHSTFTGSIFYRNGNGDDLTLNNTDNYIDNNAVFGTIRREVETEEDDSYQIALNYVNNFDNKGHKLTIDFQYGEDSETEKAFISEIESYNSIDYQTDLFGEEVTNKEDQKEYLIQTDYVLPIGEDAQFEAGYRGNFENSLTDYILLQENTGNGQFEVNENLTNLFDYTENINAVYTQFGSKIGKLSYLLGLRLENTHLKGKIDTELTEEELRNEFGFAIDTDFDNNYLGLFPTVNLIYAIGKRENITLGYNRRINRPRGWFINPFPSRSSTNNIFQGNPNLQPAYANAFDLGYLKRWEKITFTSSVYYQLETDAFERIQENVEGTNVIRTIPVNLSTNERIGGEVGMLYNPAKWLRLNGSVNFFQFKTEGEFDGRDYGAENTSWFARLSSKVSLPAKIEWQTNGFYRGASEEVQGRRDGILVLNLAFSKDLFNERATIGLTVRDLLDSMKRESVTTTPTYERDIEFQWRQGQSVNLSFIYRFNQQKRDQRRRNSEDNGMMDDGGY